MPVHFHRFGSSDYYRRRFVDAGFWLTNKYMQINRADSRSAPRFGDESVRISIGLRIGFKNDKSYGVKASTLKFNVPLHSTMATRMVQELAVPTSLVSLALETRPLV
jgi:hypothetical protein